MNILNVIKHIYDFRMIIPPKTTSKLQPLDVEVLSHCKDFAKRISNHVMLEQIDINLKERSNIITMWSLIFNQFISNKFENMKYSWYKSGLADKPGNFPKLKEILFASNGK